MDKNNRKVFAARTKHHQRPKILELSAWTGFSKVISEQREHKMHQDTHRQDDPSVLEAALVIAQKRRTQILELCREVIDRNHDKAERLARELRGHNEASNRTN